MVRIDMRAGVIRCDACNKAGLIQRNPPSDRRYSILPDGWRVSSQYGNPLYPDVGERFVLCKECQITHGKGEASE